MLKIIIVYCLSSSISLPPSQPRCIVGVSNQTYENLEFCTSKIEENMPKYKAFELRTKYNIKGIFCEPEEEVDSFIKNRLIPLGSKEA